MNTPLRTHASTESGMFNVDKQVLARASAVPPAPHGTQAHTDPSLPDPALTLYPPMTAQPADPSTTPCLCAIRTSSHIHRPRGQCSTRRGSDHTANAAPSGVTCSRPCPAVRS